MKTKKFKLISLLFICFTIFAIAENHRIYGSNTQRIALLPFKINAADDLSFLGDGIYDMFTTRLSAEGQVEVISRTKVEEVMKAEAVSGPLNEDTVRSIGSHLNADFVLFGSLTVLGENVSIDSKMVDISGSQPTMTFFDQSQDLGAVITKINLMAADINDKMFGRRTQTATKTPAAQPQTVNKANINAHPESVLEDDGFISQQKSGAGGSGVFIPAEARESQQKFWKSANFKHRINGVAVGDVDGDGKNETVIIAPNAVIIYRSESGHFRKIAEMGQSSNKFLSNVDIADINDNGYAEIFITSFNAKRTIVNSFVLEYDGEHFAKSIDDSYWIYRVADTPVRGKILLGQRPRVTKSLSGTIFEMIWQGGEYVPSDEVKTPRLTSLLGMTIGDVLNNGQDELVAALVIRDGGAVLLTEPKSTIIALQLGIPLKPESK